MARKPKGRAPYQLPRRVFRAPTGRFYWKPERRLRPHWANVALGDSFETAKRAGEDLNRKADAWLAEQKARGGAPPPAKPKRRNQPLTVGELCGLYREAMARRWRDSTRAQAHYELSVIERKFGSFMALTLERRDVRDWIEEVKDRAPETARKIGGRGHALFRWADDSERLERPNPFRGLHLGGGRKRAVRVNRAQMLHLVATADQISAEAGNAQLRDLASAFLVAFACVQRISDVLQLTRDAIRAVAPADEFGRPTGPAAARLVFAQSKKLVRRKGRLEPGFTVDMLLPGIVAARLAQHAPRETKAGLLFPGRRGRWTARGAARAWAGIVSVARVTMPGLPADLQLRDGRRSGFVQLRLDGADIPDICSISGHTIEEGMAIIEHYLPKTAEQADRAVRKSKEAWR